MSTCNRCGVSAWHPEARLCTVADCELRQPADLAETDAPANDDRDLHAEDTAA